jgi:uncharacterized protein
MREVAYRSFASYLRERFGGLVRKIPVDGGFTCPNRDGRVGDGGCIYCDVDGGTGRLQELGSIAQQMGRFQIDREGSPREEQYIAYFQSFSNTYAPVDVLRPLYEEALAQPGVVGLAVSTRPDCLPEPVLDLLEELAQRTWVSLELGVQSLRADSLTNIGRGHTVEQSLAAIKACKARGLFVCAHQIIGLPGESRDDWLATARALSRACIDAIKFHMLYVVEGTALARQWAAGDVQLLSMAEYVTAVVDVLERIRPEIVVERMVSDGLFGRTLAPAWMLEKGGRLDKDLLLAEVRKEFEARGTEQGDLL